jgi:hypothetical protein
MLAAAFRHRLYADFLMPSRLAAYGDLLARAVGAGYRVVSIEAFWALIAARSVDPAGHYLVLRHDVDTDPGTAAAMWEIERGLGIEGSYFFRLSTADIGLMRAIGQAGQASYHYEELATIAKRGHVRRPADARARLPEARAMFRDNLERLRAATGLPMRVVASHGDFVNRAVGIANREILDDPAFRDEVGIDLEVYDAALLDRLTSRYSDTHHPRYWVSGDPVDAIERRDPVIHLLVHPRHWRANRVVNARDNIRRVWEGLVYGLPVGPRASTSLATAPRATVPEQADGQGPIP